MPKNKLIDKDFRHGRHCVFDLHVHLVFVTKYRRKIFDAKAINILKTIFEKVCQDFDARLIEIDGVGDHVHLLLNYPPKVTLSKLVNSLKGVSSRMLRQLSPQIQKYYVKNVLWSPSYFAASCGGAPLSIIKQYIQEQEPPL